MARYLKFTPENFAAWEIGFRELCTIYWTAQGCTVDALGVIPKNAATGEDMPNARRVEMWCEPIEYEGHVYIVDPATDARFIDWLTWFEQYIGDVPEFVPASDFIPPQEEVE